MNTHQSFLKISNPHFHKMSKLLFILLPFSTLLLLFTLISFNSHLPTPKYYSNTPKNIHIIKHIQTAESTCKGTLYPNLCISTLSSFQDLHKRTLPEIISGTVNVTMHEVETASSNCSSLRRKLKRKLVPIDLQALDDCLQLFSNTIAELRIVLNNLSSNSSKEEYYDGLLTLLSGGMTNQATCLDGFAYSKNNTRRLIVRQVTRISRHFSNGLVMVTKMKNKRAKTRMLFSREEFPEYGRVSKGYPTWMKQHDRRLLDVAVNVTVCDLVVAKDGSGNFSTINEALNFAPNNSDTRFVICIKTGAYYEYVEVDRVKSNIMFLGDGIGNTLIKGNRSVVGNWTTFRSSTVAIDGNGFIAKGITFENYAGPSNHQAVALRSSSDFSAFYQCSFVGYQDTLYVHSFRQFYRECDIYGTVDFIFGNAAVVIQNSNLYARRPNSNQKNVFTAQGRDDPNQNTGISIMNCKIAAAADLIPVLSQFRTYLGRPWKLYSRTVYMFSNMEALVEPRGWLEWNGTFALDTLYYGEFMNRGPGSNTSARVTWPGYRVVMNSTEAIEFSVEKFVQGSQWLLGSGVPYYPNLTDVSVM